MTRLITIALLLTTSFLWAQGPEPERMQREIEVVENILITLFVEADEGNYPDARIFLSRNQVEGSYLEGFGVLFTVQPAFSGRLIGTGNVQYFFPGEERGVIVQSEAEKSEKEEDKARDPSDFEDHFRQVTVDFMANYAFLLRELPDDGKVMIRFNSKATGLFVGSASGSVRQKTKLAYSAVLSKAEILAFQGGRIDQDQLADRIAFTFQVKGAEGTQGIDRDLELLSGIFQRLYRSDLSETFRISGMPSYERIPGAGAILHLSMTSGQLGFAPAVTGLRFSGDNAIGYVIRTDENEEKAEDKPEEKGDKVRKVDEAYPGFENTLLEHIVEYGSIIKDLEENEALIFRVAFPACNECKEMPPKLEVTARRSTLNDYRQGRLTLEQAVGQLSVSHKG